MNNLTHDITSDIQTVIQKLYSMDDNTEHYTSEYLKTDVPGICCIFSSDDLFKRRGFTSDNTSSCPVHAAQPIKEINKSHYSLIVTRDDNDHDKTLYRITELESPWLQLTNVNLHAHSSDNAVVSAAKKVANSSKKMLDKVRGKQHKDKQKESSQKQQPSMCFSHSDITHVLECDEFTLSILAHAILQEHVQDFNHKLSDSNNNHNKSNSDKPNKTGKNNSNSNSKILSSNKLGKKKSKHNKAKLDSEPESEDKSQSSKLSSNNTNNSSNNTETHDDKHSVISNVTNVYLCNPHSDSYMGNDDDQSDEVSHFGVIEYNYEDRIDLNSVTKDMKNPDEIEGYTLCLLSLLDFLYTTVGFVHSSIDSNALNLVKEPLKGKYRNAKWDSKYSLQLDNFDKCSLTFPSTLNDEDCKIRLMTSNDNNDNSLTPFHPQTKKVEFNEDGREYTVITYSFDSVDDVLNITTNSGLPYYRSFDIYCMLITLHHYDWFHSAVMNSPRLKIMFWDLMWVNDEDKNKISKRLEKSRSNNQNPKIQDVLKVLKGMTLRCDYANIVLISVAGSPLTKKN